jgi:hypothetical protein
VSRSCRWIGFFTLAMLMGSVGCQDTDPPIVQRPGDEDVRVIPDVHGQRDVGQRADADLDATADVCDGVTCEGGSQCMIVGGEPQCLCESGEPPHGLTGCAHDDACAEAQCDEPNRSQCVPDASLRRGYRCECDPDYRLYDNTCVTIFCGEERARTAVTVYDMTPLPAVTNPVRQGFDPLLLGDTVRVVTEVERVAGELPLRLHLFVENMDIDPDSIRLDGQRVANAQMPSSRLLELDLGADFSGGRLAFDATIVASGADLIAVDARVFTAARCVIDGSASGARLQLAGAPNAKSLGCINMSDLRSLQISEAIPDKNTSVYEQRNGTFTDISSIYKILTQMTVCLERRDDRSVSLSGSADGTRPWTIDNHLLIEVYDSDPALATSQRIRAFSTTSTGTSAPSTYANGGTIDTIKYASLPGDLTGSRTPSPFSFPAGVLQLDDILPVGQQVWIRLTGLDTGVAGHMSRLFINSADPGEFVPECRSVRDCPRPNSYNGDNLQIRSGCLDGRCEAQTCTSDATCGAGRRCTQGFCTEGCTTDANCPAGQVCGQGYCVSLPQGGCRDYRDCPQGEVCLLGQCEAGCFHPVFQNPTYADNHAQYSVCRLYPDACPRCGDASSKCWYMYCRDCEIDAHCAAGQICADYQCVPAN